MAFHPTISLSRNATFKLNTLTFNERFTLNSLLKSNPLLCQ